ncbi:PCYCGC motif-containing (lipo)protein [Trichloromonas sp.]|uniref:PCYCGC motif-containing (lipo)protein n=1 Tax=Trichloromonas sp. TaxID=3069249 RepID=UPI003D819C7E
MNIDKTITAITAFFIIFCALPALAMNSESQKKFDLIMDMTLKELGQASAETLAAHYPGENWASAGLPDYVYGDQATEAAYKVAVKRPELLGAANVEDEAQVIPCYCTCKTFGHDNLLYCFFKNGEPGDLFDEHGAQCAVCIRQALLAYLWDDLGATHAEIMAGMKTKFAPLIEKYHPH